MNVCPVCQYKQVKNSVFEQHMLTHQIDKPEIVTVTEETKVFVPEPVVQEPVRMVDNDEITLRFTKAIEVYINGHAYLGKEIKVKNMSIAAEIVRITREAYGPNILA